MEDKIRKIGIVAGAGRLPELLIDECDKIPIKHYLIGISDNFIPSNDRYGPNKILKYGELGDLIPIFKSQKISHVILIGSLKKPSLFKIVPNYRTFIIIIKIMLYYYRGDNSLLTRIISLIESNGFKVIGADVLLSNILAKKGMLTKSSNVKLDCSRIEKYVSLAKSFGSLDKGQAIVVLNDNIVSKEDHKGTDEMLKIIAKNQIAKGGILIKVLKPNQEKRIDLPTIGPKTVIAAKNAGLSGIIIESGYTFVVDIYKTINIANAKGIFIYGAST